VHPRRLTLDRGPQLPSLGHLSPGSERARVK
jgi:hypothetical protein